MIEGQYFSKIKAFRLRNFMAFSDTGWIRNRPITLLFGQNSAGKSAILKALRLLKQSLETGSLSSPLRFYQKEGVDLGNYRTTIHQHHKSHVIGFEFKLDLPTGGWFSVGGWTFEDYLVLCYEFASVSEQVLLTKFGIYADEEDHNQSALIELQFNGEDWSHHSSFFDLSDGEYAPQWKQSRLYERRGFLVHLGSSVSPFHAEETHFGEDPAEDLYIELEPPITSTTVDNLPRRTVVDLQTEYSNQSSIGTVADRNKLSAPSFSNFANILRQMQGVIEELLDSMVHIGPVRPFADRYSLVRWPYTDSFLGKIITYQKEDDDYLDRLNRLLLASLGISVKVQPLGNSSDVPLYQLEVIEEDLHVSVRDVGSGVSQLLPILVEAVNQTSNQFVVVEQPELHLHPRAQARLADAFVQTSRLGKKFLIETHSEHLLLRLRRRIAETTLNSKQSRTHEWPLDRSDLQAYFVSRNEGISTCELIQVDEWGEYVTEPDGFVEFFGDDFNEVLKIGQARAEWEARQEDDTAL